MRWFTTHGDADDVRWALKRLPLRKKNGCGSSASSSTPRFCDQSRASLARRRHSANGKIAARLVGAIAGSGGKPTTILDLNNGGREKKPAKPKEKSEESLAAEKLTAKGRNGTSRPPRNHDNA